jgi:hypothetical protein
MKRSRFFFGFIWILSLLLLSACSDASGASKRYPDYRYRLTVEVDTPEGLKSGSSVIEVSTSKSGASSIPSPNTISTRIRGEAVAVDMGERGTLFALLRSEESVDWAAGPLLTIVPDVPYKDIEDILEKENRDPSFDIRMNKLYKLSGQYELPRHYSNAQRRPKPSDPPTAYPMMVTFKDMANPKSVTKIDPDNLAEFFGEGVKLTRITVERTDEDVTDTIEHKLAWLKPVGQDRGTLIPNPPRYLKDTKPIQLVAPNDFSTELYK